MKLDIILDEDQAWHLAEFLKRLSFNDVIKKTTGGRSKAETYKMLSAIDTLQASLKDAGINPR